MNATRRGGTVLEQAPVTLVIAVAYVGLAFVTGLFRADSEELIRLGAAVPALIAAGEPWRLLTHAFLHANLLHLGLNTYMLLLVGPALEARLGSLRFVLLYVVTALGGAVGGVLAIAPLESADPVVPLVGGSGALFGMLGALVATNLRANRSLLDFFDDGPSRSLLTLIGINLVIGLVIPRISNSAHIGGLLTGFATAFWFLDVDRRAQRDPVRRRGLWQVRVLLVVMLVGWTTYVIFPVLRWDYQLARGWHRAVLERPVLPWVLAYDTPQRRKLLERVGFGKERARRFADRWSLD